MVDERHDLRGDDAAGSRSAPTLEGKSAVARRGRYAGSWVRASTVCSVSGAFGGGGSPVGPGIVDDVAGTAVQPRGDLARPRRGAEVTAARLPTARDDSAASEGPGLGMSSANSRSMRRYAIGEKRPLMNQASFNGPSRRQSRRERGQKTHLPDRRAVRKVRTNAKRGRRMHQRAADAGGRSVSPPTM